MKSLYGCVDDIKPYDFYGEQLTRCARRPHLDMYPLISEAIQHYNWMDRGMLPAPGTWLDQTPAFIDIMDAIGRASSKVQQERAKLPPKPRGK